MRVLVPVILAALTVWSCGGGNPAPPGRSPNQPLPATQMLGWSQVAESRATLQNYDFVLFVDGARVPMTGATCTGNAPGFDCSGPFPDLLPGRHVLEVSTIDRVAGRESARSEQLVVGQSAGRAEDARSFTASTAAESQPALACAAGSSACYSVSLVKSNIGPAERLVALPDDRVLAVYGGGVVRILPDGVAERVDVGRYGAPVEVFDVAVDPEFQSNRFVFVAFGQPTVNRAAVNVARMRELGGRLGEPATIAADLPTAAQSRPVISVGPDAHVYLAISTGSETSTESSYDGLILRLTRDGAAAGYAPTGSTVLSAGSSRPSAFTWIDSTHLVQASNGLDGSGQLASVPLQPTGVWPPKMVPLLVLDGQSVKGGLRSIGTPSLTQRRPASMFLLEANPPSLYQARLNPAATEIVAMTPISLAMTPLAFTVLGSGDVMVAGRTANSANVDLVRLHAR